MDVRNTHFSLTKTKSGREIDILSIDRLRYDSFRRSAVTHHRFSSALWIQASSLTDVSGWEFWSVVTRHRLSLTGKCFSISSTINGIPAA